MNGRGYDSPYHEVLVQGLLLSGKQKSYLQLASFRLIREKFKFFMFTFSSIQTQESGKGLSFWSWIKLPGLLEWVTEPL